MHKADLKHDNRALQDKLESLYHLSRGRHIDLSFRPPYIKLLEGFGNPHENLPPVIHVAGTNGKGSTIAMLRAILSAAGYRVHVYTSPHLRKFNERIVLAGEMISDDMLENLIDEALKLNEGREITFFEITTAMAFAAFKRVPADIVLLEVGMGGKLDCTNILAKPSVSLINRVSADHMEYLGNTLDKIIKEKAGIMKYDTPCIIGYQSDEIIENCKKSPMDIFGDEAEDKNTPLYCAGKEWRTAKTDVGFSFEINNEKTIYPVPNLIGDHQIHNAGLALAALHVLRDKFPLSHDHVTYGLTHIHWPGRLEKITDSYLNKSLPDNFELWYDGGHNDSAGTAIASQIQTWNTKDPAATHIILGMKADKKPEEFLKDILPLIQSIAVTKVNDIGPCISADQIEPILAHHNVYMHGQIDDIERAIKTIAEQSKADTPQRILICGSLYLAEKL